MCSGVVFVSMPPLGPLLSAGGGVGGILVDAGVGVSNRMNEENEEERRLRVVSIARRKKYSQEQCRTCLICTSDKEMPRCNANLVEVL